MPLTPHDLGYHMPAEWEPHQATWLSWPHNAASWPGKFDAIWPAYIQAVAALTRSELVHINVNDAAMKAQARDLLRSAGITDNVQFHRFPTNDAWCRDHGAIFLVRAEAPRLAAVDWNYNAWGGKYPPYELDNEIPRQMAAYLDAPCFPNALVLEGGSIDVDGQGLLLTSEQCLLNPNRNPDLGREALEAKLCQFLGAEKILWLRQGIVGDDTDGHIDNIARFVAPGVVLAAVEEDPQDENYAPLQENLARLRTMIDLAGRPLTILTIPMPPPIFHDGQRLPASYANFYVANTVVLLPTYGHPNDQRVAEVLQRCFPQRTIVGIDATHIAWGLGAWHCLTQQVPLIS
ncbi:MAG: agmatine deiminase family protein [Candidatus Viridilinea halotolerans]|uniref:Agmatine deiminase family protein n=1 Tax=Candidatus Viridilinea halotolerans TaxID=2491704 RepID=A0A426U375_9CHLR|nr:MAG: agmatine deiminase family protein [Candidatus Viridilinea halotolerans]